MKSLKLYRVLQDHVGRMNALVVALHNDQIETAEALAAAVAELKETEAELADD